MVLFKAESHCCEPNCNNCRPGYHQNDGFGNDDSGGGSGHISHNRRNLSTRLHQYPFHFHHSNQSCCTKVVHKRLDHQPAASLPTIARYLDNETRKMFGKQRDRTIVSKKLAPTSGHHLLLWPLILVTLATFEAVAAQQSGGKLTTTTTTIPSLYSNNPTNWRVN